MALLGVKYDPSALTTSPFDVVSEVALLLQMKLHS